MKTVVRRLSNRQDLIWGLLAGIAAGWIISTAPGWLKASSYKDWWDIAAACGTLAAVVVALAAPYLQRWMATIDGRRKPLYALRAIVERGAYLVSTMPSGGYSTIYVEGYFKERFDAEAFSVVRKAIEAFPINVLADYQAIQSMFEMQDALHGASQALAAILPMDSGWADRWKSVQGRIIEAQSRADFSLVNLQVALDGAGIRR